METTTEAIQNVNIIRHILTEDGDFPNNALLPLLIYKKVLKFDTEDRGKSIEELFGSNDWSNSWQNGVYDFHHYHSITHEVLGVFRGSARIQFGGPQGIAELLEEGDVVVIPAGVAHKAIDIYDNFACVGAYPEGKDFDMNYGKPEEHERALENIKSLPIPLTDPVYGIDGPLLTNWKQ
jgi:uncharacterized protein YjlB